MSNLEWFLIVCVVIAFGPIILVAALQGFAIIILAVSLTIDSWFSKCKKLWKEL